MAESLVLGTRSLGGSIPLMPTNLNMSVESVLTKVKTLCSPEYFSDDKRGYATPSQIRDLNIDVVHNIMGELFTELKNMATEENKRRKSLPEKYIECKHCKGFHDQLKNIDGLCEKCEAITAPYRYDKLHKLI